MPDETFRIGQEFDSFEEFQSTLKKYEKENNCLFIVRRNEVCEGDEILKYLSCKYVCKQYGEPRANPKVLGLRPKQR